MNTMGTSTPAELRFHSLRAWNWSMAALHFIQGVVMVAISNDSSLPVVTSYLRIDPTNPTFGIAPTPEHWFDLRIGPAVAVFLFLSALAHFLLAGPLRHWYEANLAKGMNKLRWIEYMLSSSVMIWIIAMLCGVYDFWLLTALFSLNAIMNLMGLVMEVHNQSTTKTSWLAYWIGVFAGAIPWLVIFTYFGKAISSAGVNVPGFVYAIVFTIFATFSIFALNMVLQYKKVGPWRDYLYGERAYMILSLVAKSLLAWEIFSGTLRPS
ncbi:MAG: heliorhodopsin HeR [Candidatus Kerfeldbacteria bacterium]|nr:heliorhodopsin HeR [Candidatus Kerfeldbacteria bacterium]